jgi:hypothetical protein
MARFVFFSFAYTDVKNFKANVVRNSWLVKHKEETFVDGSIWESYKSKGASVLKGLIEDGLNKTSVKVVLIGEETANRRWINYEIVKSFERGNGLIGIYINRIKGLTGLTKRGLNPLDRLRLEVSDEGKKIKFYELKDGSWEVYSDLPEINNKKSNTIYVEDHWWRGNQFGKSFLFSKIFRTKCWDFDEGNKNFATWIEEAAKQAGR